MTRPSFAEEPAEARPGSAAGPDRGAAVSQVPEDLTRAVSAWTVRGESASLLRWLGRVLDPEGVPRRLPVSTWGPCLAVLAEGFRARQDGWPATATARIEGFFRTALHFRRPDGTAIFGPAAAADDARWLRFWAERLPDPGFRAVVRRWFPASRDARREPGIPPLPAFGSRYRPLAMLRPDWTARGDLLAVDHGDRTGPCLLELVGRGRCWLGPSWMEGPAEGPRSASRPTYWSSGALADVAEWSFRTATARIVRTAVLLRGRQLALLADQWEGAGAAATLRLAPGPGVEARLQSDSRALALTPAAGRRGSARVIPLALPALPFPTERGSLAVVGREIVLQRLQPGRRCWLPLLVSWRADRDRRPTFWRTLTVSERSRACPPEVAFAARVDWGAGEGLLFYRSLARPARRAVLGFQTKARFFIGLFTGAGTVLPLLTIEA